MTNPYTSSNAYWAQLEADTKNPAPLRKQSVAASDLREQLKRSLRVTGNDLGNALADIGRTVGVPVTNEGAENIAAWKRIQASIRIPDEGFPDKEDEPHYEEEAVDGTDSWDSGHFEDEGEDQ